MTERLSPKEILDLVPQQKPFRFLDEIVEIDEDRILGKYTFNKDEFFYPGHFPGHPVTPGVILLECMGQVGVVAHGIYLAHATLNDEVKNLSSVFTDADHVEFFKIVEPGQTVNIRGEKIFFRRLKIRSHCEMTFDDGTLVARATISGMGVKL